MKPMSIRARLTAWYLAVVVATFVLFSVIAFYAMRKSIDTTVDEGLRDQVSGVKALMGRVLPEGPGRAADELRENFELRRGAGFIQVADSQGNWIYRSPLMRRYGVPLPAGTASRISTLKAGRLPLRTLTASVEAYGRVFRVQVAAPMDDFDEALEQFRWVLLLLSPMLVIVAAAGGYWLSRRALRPVDEIARAARDISPRNLSARITVPESRDELWRLSETLNGMLDRIAEAFERITQFTADASHELRTPIALMRTTAEIALRKPRTDAEYRDSLERILKELERTSSVIEQLMLLARADSGFETLDHTRLNLAGPFREACREARIFAEAKQISFCEEISGEPIAVEGDSDALRRLFLALLDNAVKYTPLGGQITASLGCKDGFAIAKIQDTGIGIDSTDVNRIFERFYRADKARSHETGGAGLGLSIGRWIADAHGGTIEAESEPGRGSLFRVTLPMRTA